MRISDWSSDVCSSDLKGRGSEYEAQLAKLLGSAYFNKGEYEKAVEFFGFFLNSSHAAEQSTQDSYQIGYSYFKTGDYKNAIILLEPLVNGKDVWTQYAMYTLGDSFLKTNNKQNARARSEEQTSALQSLMRNSYAVLCLKKKK